MAVGEVYILDTRKLVRHCGAGDELHLARVRLAPNEGRPAAGPLAHAAPSASAAAPSRPARSPSADWVT